MKHLLCTRKTFIVFSRKDFVFVLNLLAQHRDLFIEFTGTALNRRLSMQKWSLLSWERQ